MSRSVLSPGQSGRPRWVVPAVVALVLVLVGVVAAVVVDDDDAGSGDGVAQASGATPLSVDPLAPATTAERKPDGGEVVAPDVATGVTDSTIKVAFHIPDQAVMRAIGTAMPEVDITEIWQAFIDDANERGVGGRRIEPVMTTVDPIDTTKMRAACLQWTRDDQVFAVLGLVGFYGPPVQCVTEENQTIFIDADGQPESWQDQASRGLLYTLPASKTRTLRNFADWMDRSGLLRDRTVGLIQSARHRPGRGAGDACPGAGQSRVRDHEHVPFSSDPGEAARQYSLAAAQFQREGVDTVVSTASFLGSTGMANAAFLAGYEPQYLFSAYASGTSNLVANALPPGTDVLGLGGQPARLSGEGDPEPAVDQECRETDESRTGRTVRRDSTDYLTVLSVCAVMRVFENGVVNAGSTLTRRASPTAWPRSETSTCDFRSSSFRPGKYDGGNTEQVLTVDRECKCWAPYWGARR